MVIGDIIRRNARRYPKKTAVISEDKRYTFKELNSRANSLANALLNMGIAKGDRIAILLDNCHQYVELELLYRLCLCSFGYGFIRGIYAGCKGFNS